MSAKYCKVKRCSENKGKPCAVADDCPFFKWDIEKQQQMMFGKEKKDDGRNKNRD